MRLSVRVRDRWRAALMRDTGLSAPVQGAVGLVEKNVAGRALHWRAALPVVCLYIQSESFLHDLVFLRGLLRRRNILVRNMDFLSRLFPHLVHFLTLPHTLPAILFCHAVAVR